MSWRRVAIGVAAGVALLLAAGGVYYIVKQRQFENVRGSSTVEFVPTTPAVVQPKEPGVVWPTYGYDPERLRYAPFDLRPPYRRIWTYHAGALVEFPPVVAFGRLFFAANDGDVFAVSARTGKKAWLVSSGRCQAASPAVSGRLVFVTFMNRPPCNLRSPKGVDGELVAYYAGSGQVRWRRTIGPSESSPVVAGGYVYAADWTGRVWSFVAGSGKLRWSSKVGSQIKAAPAISGNRLYVGDYGGRLYALDLRSGKVLWRSYSQARLIGRGNFYSTPALAYGRVYVGSTDGKMYSYGATSGKLRWSTGTGGYVYSSPAVWNGRVYFGSYDGSFYCLDAATGALRWRFAAHGQISGSPTVLAGIVYFATLKQRTFALDARTGKLVWQYGDGKYSPVVADRKRLYLVGYAKLYGLAPR